ncbi:ras GTPase activating protein [Entamoeba histolytica HM-3:IMSS]|uniref:Ras GTPase-activating protein, putative n=5 Tax=Entamoeba histolytica TaxID=5759 RepID=C4LW12_ENTH1|nr:Ras GTPase-activating protein, putative [Entamoeba histolytica HM-1:IMSS]EAL47068.2 Ras GTPase-activating protein, putative [Entamoeba histolytica HM-1:IMSS]EMS15651.1 ras GTPase activating protein [Entamoeba histolytica HM-3:IMSS]ENY63865.1 ras GTPase activating protein, putative [Entamoeba histolytica HM-1:IMSS-A]GAT92873.1 Ras GTPase-activating protein putative [Entamoeba histolytica]|eukprot:XP_652454.2 Ras GTPase-activating protein, putative [Entamoeba histolytica HM-1:IMSS]
MSRISIFKKKPKVKEEVEISLDIPESIKSNAIWNICRLEDYHVVSSIIRTCGVDAVPFWDAIRNCLDSDAVLIYLLKQHITEEVRNTKDKAQLFRANGGFTHLMSSFMKKEGKKILEEYINPIIKVVNEQPNELEVDNTKVSQEVVDKNIETLLTILKEHVCKFDILSKLISPDFSYIFNVIKKEVMKKWPENALIAIGGFLFLRFINPAIVSPHRFGSNMLLPNDNGHRTLILISKVVQSIANQPLCPFREECMQPFSDYVLSQYDHVNQFLNIISSNDQMPQYERSISDSVIVEEIPIIVKGLIGFKEDIIKDFYEKLDTVPGIKDKLIPMLDNGETIKRFTFFDQTAALNEMMLSMKKSIISYENEIRQLNDKIVDLYIKLGKYLPECETLPEITYKIQETKLKRIEELRKKREEEEKTEKGKNLLSIQAEKPIPTPLNNKEENKVKEEEKEVINKNNDNVSDSDSSQSEDSEDFNKQKNKEEMSESEEWSESDSEIFLSEVKETYKKKMEKERKDSITPNKASSISVNEYKELMKQQGQLPKELYEEAQKTIHTIHTLMHKVHKCNDANQLYQTSVELIIIIQKLNGKENIKTQHKNVECDVTMIPKTKDLIERLIKLLENKIVDDLNLTVEQLQKIQSFLNDVLPYLKN